MKVVTERWPGWALESFEIEPIEYEFRRVVRPKCRLCKWPGPEVDPDYDPPPKALVMLRVHMMEHGIVPSMEKERGSR